MSIYSVSTKHYFAFGCKVSEEISYKIKRMSDLFSCSYICVFKYLFVQLISAHNAALPKVRWVLPDSYLDVKNKDYGGKGQKNLFHSLPFSFTSPFFPLFSLKNLKL